MECAGDDPGRRYGVWSRTRRQCRGRNAEAEAGNGMRRGTSELLDKAGRSY